MWRGVRVKTPPTDLPVTLAEAKMRLRIDADDDLPDLEAIIRGAVSMVDGPNGIGVGLVTQTWTRAYDAFEAKMALPGWPVQSVSAVRYVDQDGQVQTLDAAAYRVTTAFEPALVEPAYGTSWPSTRIQTAAVEIDYVVGTAASLVDQGLRNAVLMIAAHLHEHRGVMAESSLSEMPLGARAILEQYRRGHAA